MDTRERNYVAFVSQPPFAAAIVRRKFDGRVVVGAVFQNERALRPVIENLKAELKKRHIDLAELTGLFDDTERATELAFAAESLIPVGWMRSYKSMDVARQSLETAVSTQGPVTSRFQIDKDGPGAEFLAQTIDNRVTGGVYDATALCCLQIEQDFESGSMGDDIKILGSFNGRLGY